MSEKLEVARRKLQGILAREGRGMTGEILREGGRGYQAVIREGETEAPFSIPEAWLDGCDPEKGTITPEMRGMLREVEHTLDQLRRKHRRKRRFRR